MVDDDLASSEVKIFNITINDINDLPEITVDALTVTEEDSIDINPDINDLDDVVPVSVITELPLNGDLYDGSDRIAEVEYTVEGQLKYQSSLKIDGTDSFKLKAYDGEAYSTEVEVDITVNNVNTNVDLDAMSTEIGFKISGTNLYHVSDAGDVNGDGVDDVIISSGNNSQNLYLIYGKKMGPNDVFNDLNLSDGDSDDFRIIGDVEGRIVSAAGDVNGDGFDDVIVGNELHDSNDKTDSGLSSILFGADKDNEPFHKKY